MAANENLVSPGSLTLHLLDSAQGHPVQTWRFHDRDTIMIGRGPDNDVSVVDPQVSRCHVLLRFCDGQWLLVSIGRNGTRTNGMHIREFPLVDQQIFQLGSTGPLFQFDMTCATDPRTETINTETGPLDDLFIDQQKHRDQVEQIVQGSGFQQLQKQVRELRDRQKVEDTKVD
jgi:pSer/pThr/pTyr-binding forkhead associated (FHA) protein